MSRVRTCSKLVPTGETRVSPYDKSLTFPVQAACGKPAVEHVVIYSGDDQYDDDDIHIFTCEEHAGRETPSENVKVYRID
jgi:hypothetical protein